jgi:TonB family protein
MFFPTLTVSLLLLAQETEAQTQRIRVGGNVQAANLIAKVTPVYPPLAKQARVQGAVRLNVIIDKEGSVKNLQLVSGHPILVPAAVEAVKQWKYKPTLLNGNPVEVITIVDINFTLSDSQAWAVNWEFLSKFRTSGAGALSAEDRLKSAKLLASGTLTGELSDGAKGWRFQRLVLDNEPFEPALSAEPHADGVPDVTAPWPQMEKRILARHEGVKPREELKGVVFLTVVVNGDGKVERVWGASGPSEELAAEAQRVVKDWRFRPVIINGQAYAVRTTIPFEFQ